MQLKCQSCRDGTPLPFEFTMAFQPIVDLADGRVWGYEALVRGPGGEPAGEVLSKVTEDLRYKFDQACRVRAIEIAGRLLPTDGTKLSINFLPNAVYEPSACIRASLQAAQRVGLAHDRLMFEFTEDERFSDIAHVERIIAEYRRQGFVTAIDDFGAGYAGLALLANLRPDLVKIDMHLVRDVEKDEKRQVIVSAIVWMARRLGIDVLAEGIETAGELAVLRAAGVRLFQGYYFARPSVESLPDVPELQPLLLTPSDIQAA